MTAYRNAAIALGVIALTHLAPGRAVPAERTPVSALQAATHIHGLAVDRADPSYLLIATHHGLYRAGPDGAAERISVVQDFMGFNAHPAVPGTLYASGHPAAGGNLGFIASTDGGKAWAEVSPGADGPVDFHQMTVSPADPRTIYGVYGGLQVSRDGGATWEMVGPAPDRLIDLTASTRSADIVYAATESGLLVTYDAGKSWTPLLPGVPVTVVDLTAEGLMRAFVYGRGLVQSPEEPLDWTTVSSDWGARYLLHLATDPDDSDRLYAATGDGAILESSDGGKTWSAFGG